MSYWKYNYFTGLERCPLGPRAPELRVTQTERRARAAASAASPASPAEGRVCVWCSVCGTVRGRAGHKPEREGRQSNDPRRAPGDRRRRRAPRGSPISSRSDRQQNVCAESSLAWQWVVKGGTIVQSRSKMIESTASGIGRAVRHAPGLHTARPSSTMRSLLTRGDPAQPAKQRSAGVSHTMSGTSAQCMAHSAGSRTRYE